MEKKVIENILRYCSISGIPHCEKNILDELEKEFKKDFFMYKRNGKFGIFVINGDPSTAKYITIFDSHVDCVQKKHIVPSFDDNTRVFTATGLDNRIGVAINHLLAKTLIPPKDECFMFLFSVREELDGTGIQKFLENMPIKERHKLIGFYEIEVCYAKDCDGSFKKKTFSFRDPEDEYELSEILYVNKLPTIGKGFCPFLRDNKTQEWGYKNLPKNNTNTRQVRKKLPKFKDIHYLAIPVVDMHYKRSRAHLDDILNLISYFMKQYTIE